MYPSYDVVVVGAGPAGSATAALLAARGARVALMDRATFPRPKVCAEYLAPDAVAMLERLGVLHAVHGARPATVHGMRIVSPNGTEATGRFPGLPGWALARDVLDTLLVEHAGRRGAVVVTGAAVRAVEFDRRWTVHFRLANGQGTIHADLLVAADGLNSRIARSTVGVRHPSSHRIALVAHYTDVPNMRDVGEMHITSFGYVGIAPVGNGLVNVSAVVDRRRDAPMESALAWFESLVSRVPSIADRVAEGRRADRVRGVGPFGRRARRAVGNRLLLVGDAAEFFDPFTGDGIWAALRGAELAAETAATPDRLSGYVSARRRAFTGKWLLERGISAVVGRPHLFDHVAQRLARRPAQIDTLVGVTGHVVPASRALTPHFLLQLAW